MTHSDIYTKFLIEYDKANITSSYPSLTRYEVATILDKAYLALIAQKLTNNNPRRVGFEADTKALEDLRPLIDNSKCDLMISTDVSNQLECNVPEQFLYYLSSLLEWNNINSIDNASHNKQIVHLVSHEKADLFKSTDSNMPWIKQPVCYMQGKNIFVLVDAYKNRSNSPTTLDVTFVKKPAKFATGKGMSANDYDFGNTEFELNDEMAEELINLAIIMSTEITESSRLSTKINTRPLES